MTTDRDYRQERRDRIEQACQEAYDADFARIEAALIAEAIEEGMPPDYRPDGAAVHRRVLAELNRRKQDE